MKITPILEKQILASNESPTAISSIHKPPRIKAEITFTRAQTISLERTHKWQYIGIFKNLIYCSL